MTETLANGYPMNTNMTGLKVFKNLCILVLWTKVASAFEGLKTSQPLGQEDSKVFKDMYFLCERGGIYLGCVLKDLEPEAQRFTKCQKPHFLI